jgi:hypothetical protein
MENATIEQWKTENLIYQEWYFETYPFLKQFEFPIPYENLKDFYVEDMQFRNLTPLDTFAENYDFVFSYFLENYPKILNSEDRFKARNFLERVIDVFPKAIEKSFNDIGETVKDSFNFLDKYIYIVLIILVLLFLIKTS